MGAVVGTGIQWQIIAVLIYEVLFTCIITFDFTLRKHEADAPHALPPRRREK